METITLYTILLTGALAIAASMAGQWLAGFMTERRARRERFSDEKRALYLQALEHIAVVGSAVESITHMRIGAGLALFDSRVAQLYFAAADARFAWELELDEMRSRWLADNGVNEVAEPGVEGSFSRAIRTGQVDSATPAGLVWASAFIALGRAMQGSLDLKEDFDWGGTGRAASSQSGGDD